MSVVSVIIRAIHDSTQALSSIQRQTDAYYRLSTGTNQAVMRFEALHGSSRRLFGMWNSLSVLSAAPGRMAGSVVEGIQASVNSYAGLQRALFETKFQGGATEEELASLRQTAESMAPVIGRTSTEIVNLGRMLRAAGLAGEEMQSVLSESLKFGTAFSRLDTKVLADIGIVAWQRFGKEVGSASKLMEMLLNFTGAARIDPENLLAWLNALGSLNITAKGQLPAIMTLGAIMSRSGATAAESAHKVNILVNSLVNLDRMALQASTTGGRYIGRLKKAAKEALHSDVFDAGKFRDLLEVLDDIDAATANMTEEDTAFQMMNALRQQAKDVILARREFTIKESDLSEITGDMSDEVLRGGRAAEYLSSAMSSVTGRLDRGAAEAKNLTGTLQGGLTAAIDSLRVAIGEKAAPVMDWWNRILSTTTQRLATIIQATGPLGSFFAAVGLGAASAVSATAQLLANLSGIVFNLAGFSVFMRQMGVGRTGLGGGKLGAGAALFGAGRFALRSLLGVSAVTLGKVATGTLLSLTGAGALALAGVGAYEAYKHFSQPVEKRQYSSSTGPATTTPAMAGNQRPMKMDLNVQATVDKQVLMGVVRRDLETKKLRDWHSFRSDVLGH